LGDVVPVCSFLVLHEGVEGLKPSSGESEDCGLLGGDEDFFLWGFGVDLFFPYKVLIRQGDLLLDVNNVFIGEIFFTLISLFEDRDERRRPLRIYLGVYPLVVELVRSHYSP
jgi:hypothetical protein